MSPFPSQLQHYAINLLYAPGDIFIECHCCNDVAKNAATTTIGFSIRTVRAYIFHACDIFECHPSYYSPCKNLVTFNCQFN